MKYLSLIFLVLMLTGCSMQTAAWETVSDTMSVPVSGQIQADYDVTVGLSESALTDRTENCRHYETETLQVDVWNFQAADLHTAVRQLSGFEAEKLTILQTNRFDLPEYQFAWYCQTEEGGRLCRADLVMDGMTCYAVVCSFPEEAGEHAWEEARQVFSSFGLSPAEIL